MRSTDLLALPNVNPDNSFAIQLSHEETLDDVEVAFLQSALLYTSVRGERRIRVATIALPVTTVITILVGLDKGIMRGAPPGLPWVWESDFPCENRMGMEIEIPLPRQPCAPHP